MGNEACKTFVDPGGTESDAESMAICGSMSIIGLMGGYLDLQITQKRAGGICGDRRDRPENAGGAVESQQSGSPPGRHPEGPGNAPKLNLSDEPKFK
jgi:hypothetical protein